MPDYDLLEYFIQADRTLKLVLSNPVWFLATQSGGKKCLGTNESCESQDAIYLLVS